MTVGIGVLCEHGEVAVVASDMRTTFPRSNVTSHDATGKVWDFDVSFPLIAAVAGNLGDCSTLVSELNHRLKQVSEEGEVFAEHVENIVREARLKVWARRADHEIRRSYLMSLKDWQTGKLGKLQVDPFIHDAVRKLIDSIPSEVELLIAGFTKSGNILFYKASRKRMLEPGVAPGVLVIGSGGQLAMDHLNKRGQNIENGLPRSLLHLSEAMDEARKVADKSVGGPMAYTVVQNDGKVSRISPNVSIFSDWKNAYKDRQSTASLDGNTNAQTQVRMLLQKHVAKPSNT